jgi:hypothetical protein
VEPIHTHDAVTAACAYISVLNWPLAVGYRHRPRQGCTCERTDCPTPGAHSLRGATATSELPRFLRELEAAPGAALIAPTTAFDALVVPVRTGMSAMTELEHLAPVPCIVQGDSAVLLVLPATGRYAAVAGCGLPLDIRSGPEQSIALPPTHGNRWDTHPWIDNTSTAIPLLHGQDVGRRLAAAFERELEERRT